MKIKRQNITTCIFAKFMALESDATFTVTFNNTPASDPQCKPNPKSSKRIYTYTIDKTIGLCSSWRNFLPITGDVACDDRTMDQNETKGIHVPLKQFCLIIVLKISIYRFQYSTRIQSPNLFQPLKRWNYTVSNRVIHNGERGVLTLT